MIDDRFILGLENVLAALGLLERLSAVEFFMLLGRAEARLAGSSRGPGEITLAELAGMLTEVRRISARRGARCGLAGEEGRGR